MVVRTLLGIPYHGYILSKPLLYDGRMTMLLLWEKESHVLTMANISEDARGSMEQPAAKSLISRK